MYWILCPHIYRIGMYIATSFAALKQLPFRSLKSLSSTKYSSLVQNTLKWDITNITSLKLAFSMTTQGYGLEYPTLSLRVRKLEQATQHCVYVNAELNSLKTCLPSRQSSPSMTMNNQQGLQKLQAAQSILGNAIVLSQFTLIVILLVSLLLDCRYCFNTYPVLSYDLSSMTMTLQFWYYCASMDYMFFLYLSSSTLLNVGTTTQIGIYLCCCTLYLYSIYCLYSLSNYSIFSSFINALYCIFAHYNCYILIYADVPLVGSFFLYLILSLFSSIYLFFLQSCVYCFSFSGIGHYQHRPGYIL